MKTFYKAKTLYMAGAISLFSAFESHAQFALDLNGAGNKMTTNYTLNPAAGYTIEYDMYMHVLKDFNSGLTFTCGNKANPIDMYVSLSGNVSCFSGNCAAFSTISGGTMASGVWYHIAYVYDPSTISLKLYVNGSLAGTGIFTESTSATSFILGDRADGVTNADAKYDNVKIWTTVRTPAEVFIDQMACFTGSEPGLSILYRFEEGSGTTVYDAALGDGAQDGTVTGTFAWNPGFNSPVSSGSTTISACNSYTSPSGNYTWVTSGSYTDTITNVYGCDSIVTINLTIDNMPFTTAWSNGYNTGYMLLNGMFLNDNLGWSNYWAWDVATSFIAKTTDGGATYTSTSIPGNYIGGVAFVDASTGFACGNNSSGNMIAKSTDGGSTWTPVTYPTPYIDQLNTIEFNDALHGTAGGYGGALYSTSDGGTTWNYSLVDAGNVVFNDIDYLDNNTICAVGYLYPGVEGRVYLSTDGGATWTLKHSSTTYVSFQGVKFIDAMNGFTCGGGAVFRTTDGGNTWAIAFTGLSGEDFKDIEFGAGKYWLTGNNGSSPVLYNSTDAITWTPISISPATTSIGYHLMVPSANKVYINGDRLIIGTNNTLFNASVLDPTICSGDGSDLTASGATSYDWSNGATTASTTVFPTSTSSYTVTGHSGSCSMTSSLTVNVLQPSSGTDVQSACVSYMWIDGNTYSSSTNSPTFTMTNAVGCDSVITLNLTILNPTTGTDVQTACDSFTWIDGNTYSGSTSTPTFTLTNAAGCDSVVTLNLTINTVNTGVTNADPTLTALATGATYQWVNCATSFSPISGATNQNFTATSNGSYAVVVTQSGCTDTSACQSVIATGIAEAGMATIQVYPNPASENLTIVSDYVVMLVRLFDVKGMVVHTTTPAANHVVIDVENLSNGVYMLEITGINNQLLGKKRIIVNK
ncbi:MAG TPA: LamG-like jellyroll fold domain-containing protein [Flavobacteriales bacterium]|nr:LamG-like jellyroll fold domain-containing protein [Flavobacteriales bacterium]